jgi:hypothetical protein
MLKKGTYRGSGPLIALAIATGIFFSAGGPASAQFFNFGGSHHRPHWQRGSGWFGGGWFGNGPFDPFHQRALRPRWDTRSLATPAREDFHRFHRVQRKNDSLKAHDVMPKMLPDEEAAQAFGADLRPRGNDDAMAGESPVNRTADEVQPAPPSVIEPKVVIGAALADPSADVVQVILPPIIEDKPVPITKSHDALTIGMVMVALSVLGLIEFLFRPTSAKRVLAFGAMSRSKRAPNYVHNLSVRPLNQVEADFLQWSSSPEGDAGHTNDRGARRARLEPKESTGCGPGVF